MCTVARRLPVSVSVFTIAISVHVPASVYSVPSCMRSTGSASFTVAMSRAAVFAAAPCAGNAPYS